MKHKISFDRMREQAHKEMAKKAKPRKWKVMYKKIRLYDLFVVLFFFGCCLSLTQIFPSLQNDWLTIIALLGMIVNGVLGVCLHTDTFVIKIPSSLRHLSEIEQKTQVNEINQLVEKRIQELLLVEVCEMKIELLGTDSPFHKRSIELDEKLREARTLFKQLGIRSREYTEIPDRLVQAVAQVRETIVRLERLREQLDAQRAKTNAFFDETSAILGSMHKTYFRERELIRKVRELCHGTDALERDVDRTISEMTTELWARMTRLQALNYETPQSLFSRDNKKHFQDCLVFQNERVVTQGFVASKLRENE